jgi:lysophospholipase
MTLISTPGNPVPSGAISGMIRTSDGIELRFARWNSLGGNRGTVCVFNGRGEFIEKYFETVNELRQRGFAVATMDWRGQGHSSRQLPDRRKGHVENFSQYETDVNAFMQQVVLGDCPPPYLALAHSTGGAVLLRIAHSGKPWFERFVFSAPMIDLAGMSGSLLARALARTLRFVGLAEIYMPGPNSSPDQSPRFEGNELTSDKGRFDRNVGVVKADPTLAIGPPTVAWLNAAFDAFIPFQDPKYPSQIHRPTLILAAGADTIVSIPAIKQFAARLSAGSQGVIDGARHEILQEQDSCRAQFWAAFDAFVPGASA